MDLEMLQRRAAIIKQVRSFFDGLNYLELDTPLLSGDLIPESCLEVFQTERIFPPGSQKKNHPLWLIPSPEIWMKKIIAQHRVNVYQICKCFRNSESEGRLHNNEFLMLEYYTLDADYMDSLALTEELFNYLTTQNLTTPEWSGEPIRTKKKIDGRGSGKGAKNAKDAKEREVIPNYYIPFERITIADAFKRWAGFDLFAVAAEGTGAMEKEAKRLGINPMPNMTVPQLYDLIFIHSVEPQLKMAKPVALIDYPAFVPCLAKKAANGQTVERWELYYNGIELTNCFSEETDPQKVKEFFYSEEAEKKQNAIVQHNINHDYWKLFEKKAEQDFPRCSGVAMGLDRLIMALTGKADIDGVLPFK